MTHQQNGYEMDRRRILTLAGFGALAASLPMPLMAVAGREYPTLNAKLKEYLGGRKAAGMVMAVGHGNEQPDYIQGGKLAFASKTPVDKDSLFRMLFDDQANHRHCRDDAGRRRQDHSGSTDCRLLTKICQYAVLTDPENSLDAVPAKTQITCVIAHAYCRAWLYYHQQGAIRDAYVKAGVVPGQVS